MKLFWKKVITFFMTILAFLGIIKPTVITTTLPEGSVEILGIQATVSLEANATTGYAWQCVMDGNAVQLKEDRYVPDPSDGAVGAGGTQIYTFEVVQPGQTTVTFKYQRSWEKEPIRTETLILQVSEDLTLTIPA